MTRRLRATPLPVRIAPRCRLGEGARWDGSRWWWLDVANGRGVGTVFVAAPGSAPRRAFQGRGRVSAIAPDGTGGARINCGRAILDLSPRGAGFVARHVVDLDVPPGHVLNDGIGDGRGGLVVGTVDPHGSPTGLLLAVDAHGDVTTIGSGFAQSNGLAFAADGSLLHADSSTRTLWRHSLEPTGTVSTVYAELGDGLPDGLCSVPNGDVWVAVYGTGEVRRYHDGDVAEVVEVATPQVTSVALGGPAGDELLITTAREGFDAVASRAEPLAGRLFSVRQAQP